jgi:phenylpropionate dioxygenase-like ring-hydroxylating dioxygenase large terminal subunit
MDAVKSIRAQAMNELDEAGEARLYRALRHFWHPVMLARDLTDEPQRVVLLDELLVMARMAGDVKCFADLCAHRGAALSEGWVQDDELRCAYHGWTYGPDGRCTAIPSRFGQVVPQRARIPSFAAREAYGIIWVCLAPEPKFGLPRCDYFDDPRYRVVVGPVYEWRSSAPRRMENFVDFAHFAWVHDGVLGSRDKPEVPEHEVWREGSELRFTRLVSEPVSGFTKVASNASGDGWADVDYDYRLTMPLTVCFNRTIHPGGESYVLMMSASPTGPKLTRSFWLLCRNYALDENDGDFVAFEKNVLEQDRRVVESQRPEMLPFDLSAELHIRGVDKVSVEYRRWLVELAGQLEPVTAGA